MNSTECRGCDTQMTWAEQRRQFGRACAAGLTAEDAKAQMPRCQRCTTTMLLGTGSEPEAGAPAILRGNDSDRFA